MNRERFQKTQKINEFDIRDLILKKGKLFVSITLLTTLIGYSYNVKLNRSGILAVSALPARLSESSTPGTPPIDIGLPIKKEEPKEEIVEDIHTVIANRIKNDNIPREVFTVIHKDFTISPELNKKFVDLIKNHNKTNSFYVVSLDGKLSMGYNIDYVRSACCVSKASYAMYVYKEIEKGNGSLDEIMVYEKRHHHGGSGNIQYSKFGTKFTLEDVVYRLLHISDNDAYMMLQERFPHAGYNEMLKKLGCKEMLFGKGYKFGFINAREVALVWNELIKYSKETKMGKKLFDILLNAKFNYIKDALLLVAKNDEKNLIKVAHKSGWTYGIRNDAGVVLGDTPYIIVVTTPDDRVFFNKAVQLSNEVIKEYTNYLNNKIAYGYITKDRLVKRLNYKTNY